MYPHISFSLGETIIHGIIICYNDTKNDAKQA